MTRPLPMAPCLALLKAFDPNNETPQQTIAAAAAELFPALSDQALADLNEGQLAALIDLTIWKTLPWVTASNIFGWVQGGNFAKPPKALALLGPRGAAERDIWNVGSGG